MPAAGEWDWENAQDKQLFFQVPKSVGREGVLCR